MKFFYVLWLGLLTSFTSFASDNQNGEKLFNQLCVSCHAVSGKPTIAPPIFGVINHVKNVYPNREEFVEQIVNWVENPEAEKALMPGAVKKFGLMPKLGYDSQQVRQVAEYLYQGQRKMPGWYREHYKKEHGKNPKQH